MIIFVDIDKTICDIPENQDYTDAIPRLDDIAKINKLYLAGHYICYWTARGTVSGLDWKSLTEKQLREWGAKHHELKMGKPHYDIFVDDKALSKIEDIDDVIYSGNG